MSSHTNDSRAPEDMENAGDARSAYYATAGSWAQDRQETLARSRSLAWVVAVVAIAIALLEALALLALVPLKTIVPYTLLVDRATGHVQTIKGDVSETIRPEAALTQSMLAQYVIARESFDIGTVGDQYRKVALWSAAGARQAYLTRMPASNPNSPINVYSRSTKVSAQISSVSPLGPQRALVRFSTELHDRNRSAGSLGHWVAVIRYHFSSEPLSMEDRLENPLGFQVTEYRRDQESLSAQDEGTGTSFAAMQQREPLIYDGQPEAGSARNGAN